MCLILEAEFPFSCCLSHCLPPSSVWRMRRLWQYHCHPLLCALRFLSDLHYSTCGRVLLSDGLWWELKLACSSMRYMVKDQCPICLAAWLQVSCCIHNSGQGKQYDCKARLQFSKFTIVSTMAAVLKARPQNLKTKYGVTIHFGLLVSITHDRFLMEMSIILLTVTCDVMYAMAGKHLWYAMMN